MIDVRWVFIIGAFPFFEKGYLQYERVRFLRNAEIFDCTLLSLTLVSNFWSACTGCVPISESLGKYL